MDLPLYHSAEALNSGKSSIIFNRDMPSRFCVLPRYGNNDSTIWFEADPCYIYHVINAWEEGNEVILDASVTIDPIPQKDYVTKMEKLNAYLRLEANIKRYRFNLKLVRQPKTGWMMNLLNSP